MFSFCTSSSLRYTTRTIQTRGYIHSHVPESRSLHHRTRLSHQLPKNHPKKTTEGWKTGMTKKNLSTESAGESASGSGAGSLVLAVGTTFGTYMLADFLSNTIQHPGLKMDYGYFNQFLNRPVQNDFWGTRTQHIIGVAACLAVTDHTSQHFFSSYLRKPLCFAQSPAAFVLHTFVFIAGGVAIYCTADSMLNPDIQEEKRCEVLKGELYSTVIGSCTTWYEPYVAPALSKIVGQGMANSWAGSALLPATLAYSTVKGVGWNDWGVDGLSDFEKLLNGKA